MLVDGHPASGLAFSVVVMVNFTVPVRRDEAAGRVQGGGDFTRSPALETMSPCETMTCDKTTEHEDNDDAYQHDDPP